jgi:hypothetical protein
MRHWLLAQLYPAGHYTLDRDDLSVIFWVDLHLI